MARLENLKDAYYFCPAAKLVVLLVVDDLPQRQVLANQLRPCAVIVITGLLFNSFAAGSPAASAKELLMNSAQQGGPSVSDFFVLRNSAFEQMRKVFFGDVVLLGALKAHEKTNDPIEKFLARTLVRWAAESPPSIQALEHFILIEVPQRTKDNRSAGSAQNETALLRLASKQQDPQQALDYLMLRALTRPRDSELAFEALASLYAHQAPKEVEAWIRIAVEDGTDPTAVYFVEQSLPHIAQPIVKRALDIERARLMRVAKHLPAALEQYRTKSAVR